MSAPARPSPAAAPPLLALEEAGRSDGERAVLRGVSFELAPGTLVALVGASGAGKSLVVRLLLGLEACDAGRVRLLGHELGPGPEPLAAPERARLARRLGVVWPTDALFEGQSVARNVGFLLREVLRRPASEVARAVRESLLLVGLKHVEHVRVDDLAAGARRRVALARAIAHGPALLVLDEPAADLDPVGADAIGALVGQLRDRLGLGVLVATRDVGFARRVAQRLLVLHEGRIVADGAPDAVLRAPHEAVQQLLSGRAHGPIAP